MSDELRGEGGDRDEGTSAARSSGPVPHPIYNWMSFIGGSLVAVGATATVFFTVIDMVTEGDTGYAGLMLIFPVFAALVGVVLVAGGWLRERRRQKRGERSSFFDQWVVDPFAFVRRIGPMVVVGGVAAGTLTLLAAGAGSVAVIEFSESNTFCGDVCHEPMRPEAIAHEQTAHSRLHCVDCHVGAGAEGFLRAKIGGLRQLWAVTVGSVKRPIPTPIHSGTIGRDLCERCHSPERDSGYRHVARSYFLNGMEDMPVELAMVVKVGGANELLGGSGIHYHMQIAEKVEFIARDPQRQDIAWVRVVNGNGETREYTNEATPLTEEERRSLPVLEMDCIDCHSRPAHAFAAPVDAVNAALAGGRIPGDLPYVKEASVRALDGGYATTDEAMEGIEHALQEYYEDEDPDVLEERSEDLAQTAELLRGIYEQTIFPEMKADWTTHPDNSGHRDSPGCFRCHNDEMVREDGEPIFASCSGCHAVLAQDEEAIRAMSDFDRGMDFVHPEDSAAFEEFSLCSDCHDGGKTLYD